MDRATVTPVDTTHVRTGLGRSVARPRWLFGVRIGKSVVMAAWPVSAMVTWLPRVTWVLTGVFGWPAITGALEGRSDAVRLIGTVGAVVVWLIGVGAMAVPAVATLTAMRAVVPLAPAIGLATVAAGVAAVDGAALIGLGTVATVVAFSADVGRAFVQASAYGDEDRHPLRPPLGFAIATIVSWLLWSAAIVTGPLLLAARSWPVGVVATVVGAAGTVVLPPRWHRLSRRWFVVVPAGLVVHDHVVLAETVMVRRSQIAGARLAPSDTGALDLTGPATGNAIEVALSEPVTVLLAATPQEPRGRAVHATALLVAPSRPGRALAATGRRRIPVG
jgi:hypothetical protein